MTDERTRKLQGQRLAAARLKAGWRSARAAALENNWAESSYRAHENGSRTIGQDDAETYARRFRAAGANISAQDILFGVIAATANQTIPLGQVATAQVGSPDVTERIALTLTPQKGGRPDLAVRGIALGGAEGEGDFQLNGNALDYIPRPAGLLKSPNAFAVILRNTSMEPVYKHGWPVFIDPEGRKPVEGEDVLIELYGDDPDDRENGPAFIKTLVARRGGQHILRQYNPPPEELRFDSARVKNLYRVIPYPEAMGLSV